MIGFVGKRSLAGSPGQRDKAINANTLELSLGSLAFLELPAISLFCLCLAFISKENLVHQVNVHGLPTRQGEADSIAFLLEVLGIGELSLYSIKEVLIAHLLH